MACVADSDGELDFWSDEFIFNLGREDVYDLTNESNVHFSQETVSRYGALGYVDAPAP